MNGTRNATNQDPKPDLLPHKYRPQLIDQMKCNQPQAQRLKEWIQEFLNVSNTAKGRSSSHSDYDDSDVSLVSNPELALATKCVLLTGSPGVGKTSLVYTIANELKLHVVESHPSEKRDFKLFSNLELTNQRGKINPIAKLFQVTAQQHQKHKQKRKRRKLSVSNEDNKPTCLSLSDDTSIILFDDIDVVFEEDGPFLKSLVKFIKDSKRPIVLTATQSIDFIKETLILCEHINLERPNVDDCTDILVDVCRREKLYTTNREKICRGIATEYGCDIRQCLNKIHFDGELAQQYSMQESYILPKFNRLNLKADGSDIDSDATDIDDSNLEEYTPVSTMQTTNHNRDILECYTNNSLIDLMNYRLNYADRPTLLKRWLNGHPTHYDEEYNHDHFIGQEIKQSIIELTRKLYSSELMTDDEIHDQRKMIEANKVETADTSQRINQRIKARIEPPEVEFYTDYAPAVCELVQIELARKSQQNGQSCPPPIEGLSFRRSHRYYSYLDSIGVYFEAQDKVEIARKLLSDVDITVET